MTRTRSKNGTLTTHLAAATISSSSKPAKMTRSGRRTKTTLLFLLLLALAAFCAFVPALSLLLPSLPHGNNRSSSRRQLVDARTFEIAEDMFWKDGHPFRIIGGDLHYFRTLPEVYMRHLYFLSLQCDLVVCFRSNGSESFWAKYWEDRLLKVKALGLNTIQTYVPWNLHEPQPGKLSFEGIADLVSFLKLCQKLDLLVMLRAGPYICGEWDLGGFPAWLLATEPPLKLRSSDPAYLRLVDKWWGTLLPKVAPLLYNNGGPIIMVQIENEFGSYGDDQNYLHHLVQLARRHLGDSIILYTTDGGARENLQKGTIRGGAVFSAVDFTTGDDPWPIFKLQKEFNEPGKSPPLSTEFYTGWLTHWGEKIATTDAESTASALEKILSRNGSAVLYMAHGGTNFGFYSGANTGTDESDYKPDLTSYDYVSEKFTNLFYFRLKHFKMECIHQTYWHFKDAPISESGDVDGAKFTALRKVISLHSATSLPQVPANIRKIGYGPINLHKTSSLFDLLDLEKSTEAVESVDPLPMESLGQMFGFVVYISSYSSKVKGNSLFIPEVHDRAQVFTSCATGNNKGRPTYIGAVERWSNKQLGLPNAKCTSNTSLFVLVENMGRVNYGQYTFDRKGILSSVYIDGKALHGWRMISVPLHNLNEEPKINLNEMLKVNPISRVSQASALTVSTGKKAKHTSRVISVEPTFYAGSFSVDKANPISDTYISFRGWGKGVAFVNDFNIGRYWPVKIMTFLLCIVFVGPLISEIFDFHFICSLLDHNAISMSLLQYLSMGRTFCVCPLLNSYSGFWFVQVILELESPSPELLTHSVDNQDFTCGSRKPNLQRLDVL
ncbi:unnamed protein product [Linum tenue]|uniref:Beta-galactosidase n=1 Tax=Linum tenue TaxID=586396 RepID=A0AAV0KDM0_9ROSI|nr:unnamed protein product [Linum tenue]